MFIDTPYGIELVNPIKKVDSIEKVDAIYRGQWRATSVSWLVNVAYEGENL